MSNGRNFPNPHEVKELVGTEGWQEMYPYYYPFASTSTMPKTATYENSMLWFYDGLHYPEPVSPLDLTWDDMWHHTASAWVGRIHVFPGNWGRDHRMIMGRVYIDSTDVDPALIPARVPEFEKRVAFALTNWEELFKKWVVKVEKLIRDTDAMVIPRLPELDSITVIREGTWSTGHDLLVAWNRLMENVHLIWEWHFEFNNLVSLVNVQYIEFVKKLFPGITDKSITQTLSGFDAMLFKAFRELLILAKLALQLKVEDVVLSSKEWKDVEERLQQSPNGKHWVDAWKKAQDPWFNMSCASGWYHTDGSWCDTPSYPLNQIQQYIGMLQKGENLDKPIQEVLAERDRVTEEYRGLISNDDDRKTFDSLLATARKCAHYVEDHDFYVENWSHTVFYKKFRDFGQIMVDHGVIKAVDDIYFMNRFEIPEVLHDITASWYCGVAPYGREYWPPKIDKRKAIFENFKEWRAPEALGPAPDDFTNPVMINEYGFDNATIERWLGAQDIDVSKVSQLKGYAGSAGVVEGSARVCLSVDDLGKIQTGDILVAPSINPAWSAYFPNVSGVVTDIGGIFGHAAIVAREYKLPAVVATGTGTKVIKTGDKIKVDGDTGMVYIVARA
jgi:pyruvate,water dikinase